MPKLTPAHVRRVPVYLAYQVVKNLPATAFAGIDLWRRLRQTVVRRMFESTGDWINVNRGANFGAGIGMRLGNGSSIGIDASLQGPVHIGDNVMMGPNCTILTAGHHYDRLDIPMVDQGIKVYGPTVIEDDVWIGAHVLMVPGVRVGRGSILAAGSVITTDVEPFSIMGGNPAKVIRSRLDS